MNKTFIGAIYLSLAASIWGGMFVVAKYVLDFVPPFTLMWTRYLIGFAVLFGLLKIQQKKKKQPPVKTKKDWLMFLWIGFIGYFVAIACQFFGVKFSNAHTGSLITAATPAVIVLFAKFLLNEKLTKRKMLALFLATAGVLVTINWQSPPDGYLLGTLILVGAVISWALLSVYAKIAEKKFPPLETTTYAVLFAWMITTPFMIWELQSSDVFFQNTYVILGILYQGIVATAASFFLWNKGLQMMEAGKGSLFFFFQPIVGTLFGWLLLGEQIHWNFFLGGALILLGIIVITVHPHKQQDYGYQNDH